MFLKLKILYLDFHSCCCWGHACWLEPADQSAGHFADVLVHCSTEYQRCANVMIGNSIACNWALYKQTEKRVCLHRLQLWMSCQKNYEPISMNLEFIVMLSSSSSSPSFYWRSLCQSNNFFINKPVWVIVTTHPLFRSKVLQNICFFFFFILTKTKNEDETY